MAVDMSIYEGLEFPEFDMPAPAPPPAETLALYQQCIGHAEREAARSLDLLQSDPEHADVWRGRYSRFANDAARLRQQLFNDYGVLYQPVPEIAPGIPMMAGGSGEVETAPIDTYAHILSYAETRAAEVWAQLEQEPQSEFYRRDWSHWQADLVSLKQKLFAQHGLLWRDGRCAPPVNPCGDCGHDHLNDAIAQADNYYPCPAPGCACDDWQAPVETIKLTRTSTVGFHYVDEQGEPWSTVHGPAVPCAICGASITRGYESSYRTGEQRVCVEHVQATPA